MEVGRNFRLAAHPLHRDPTPMGDYLRRMKAKLGPAAATTATAHKIAVVFYTMVSRQIEYDASLWAQRDALREKLIEARLHKQAAQRGYKLVPLESAASLIDIKDSPRRFLKSPGRHEVLQAGQFSEAVRPEPAPLPSPKWR